MKVTVCEQFHWTLSQFGWDVFQQVSPRNPGFQKRPYSATCRLLCCLSLLENQRRLRFCISLSVYLPAVKPEVLFSLRGAIIKVPRFHNVLIVEEGVRGQMRIVNPVPVYKNKEQYDGTNTKVLLPVWISPSLQLCPLGEVSFQPRQSCLLSPWPSSI